MPNPRAIAQVRTAASGTTGAGVTMDVSDASLFRVGQTVELYPSQYGDGEVIARARQTMRYTISAIAGAQLTGTMNPDSYSPAYSVVKGWTIDGTDLDSSSDHAIVVDDITYAITTTGIQNAINDAFALGGQDVIIKGGKGAKVLAATGAGADADGLIPIVNLKNGVHIYIGPGTWLTPPADANNYKMFSYLGTAAAATAKQLTAASNRGAITITIAAGGAAAGGIVAGSYVQILDSVGTVRNQINRVVSVAAGASDVITIEDPVSFNFTTSDFIKAITAYLDDCEVEGEFRVGSNTGNTRAVSITYGVNCHIQVTTKDFDNHANSVAVYLGAMWNLYMHECNDDGSGNSGAAAYNLQSIWHSRLVDSGTYPTGFGWLIEYSGHLANSGLYAVAGVGRGFKYSNCHDVTDVSPEASHWQTGGGTGYGIMDGSSHFVVYTPRAYGNSVAGIYTANSGGFADVTHITFVEPEALGNGTDLSLTDVGGPTIKVVGGRFETVGLGSAGFVAYGGYTLAKQAAVAVTSTVTETAILSKTIPAYTTSLLGRVVEGELTGNYQNNTGADRRFTLRAKYGATTIFDDITALLPANAAFRAWRINFTLFNDGTNTVIDGVLRVSAVSAATTGVGDMAANDTVVSLFRGSVANGTEAPTTDKTLAITIEHTNADVTMNSTRGQLKVA